MPKTIDYTVATSEQIESYLCGQVKKIRLTYNLTQAQLARKAGVTTGTIQRLEDGKGTSLNTFIRALMGLGLQQNLETLLPDPAIRPIERVHTAGKERRRARPKKQDSNQGNWVWGVTEDE